MGFILADRLQRALDQASIMVTFPLPTSYRPARIASLFCFTSSPKTGEVSLNTEACSLAFCLLAVVRSPLEPATAG